MGVNADSVDGDLDVGGASSLPSDSNGSGSGRINIGNEKSYRNENRHLQESSLDNNNNNNNNMHSSSVSEKGKCKRPVAINSSNRMSTIEYAKLQFGADSDSESSKFDPSFGGISTPVVAAAANQNIPPSQSPLSSSFQKNPSLAKHLIVNRNQSPERIVESNRLSTFDTCEMLNDELLMDQASFTKEDNSILSGELDFGEMRNSPDEGWTAAV